MLILTRKSTNNVYLDVHKRLFRLISGSNDLNSDAWALLHIDSGIMYSDYSDKIIFTRAEMQDLLTKHFKQK